MKTEGRNLGLEILQGIKEIQRYKNGKSKSLKLRETQVDLNSETRPKKAEASRQK